MKDSAPNPNASADADARLARLLAYRTPLDGAAFIRTVHASAARRRRQRRWVMVGSAAAATAAAFALRPQHFDAPPILGGLVEQVMHLAGTLPIGPMAAIAAAITVCLGASRAMDSI